MIELPSGVFIRRVEGASLLRGDTAQGSAAEEATGDAVATWGLPDFIFTAGTRAKGQATRELGDRLLVVGSMGVVIQVKRRVATTDDAARERRWIVKQISKAVNQANGTIRALTQQPVTAASHRGDHVDLDTPHLEWLIAVIIDHPSAPEGVTPALHRATRPGVVLLRRDWEFLFEQLKSTHAVVRYIRRVSAEQIELGQEPVRYFELSLADQQAPPGVINPKLTLSGRTVSTPLLPLQPVAADDGPAHLVLRSIFEDIATSKADHQSRLRVLSELDRLPVSQRSQIGRALIHGLQAVTTTDVDETRWWFRRIVGPDDATRSVHLGFGACSWCTELQREAFRIWVQLRHHEMQEITEEREEMLTVGVLLSPRNDGMRPWDTTMVAIAGAANYTYSEVAAMRTLWKAFDDPALEP
jgi:hypothetical protein